MEQNVISDNAEEFSQRSVSSIPNFPASYSAQTGGIVVAPSIVSSSNININIDIVSEGKGARVSSKDALNLDTEDSSCTLQSQNEKIAECQRSLRDTLKKRFSYLLEGKEANKIPLDKVYTELYITEGGGGEVNKEHEVRQLEMASRIHPEKSIHYNQLFDSTPGPDPQPRTVITRGVAGIGKTVSAHKFALDWAAKNSNTNLEFVFPLSFRELNLMRKKFSLVALICEMFPATKDTGIFTNGETKMLFILDGLDESRLSLNFHSSELISDVKQTTTVSVLLTNLIRGRLLPHTFVWITTRPAASGQIPVEYIDLVTEVRGFSNQQKDEYFRRKIEDQNLADRIITHVKSCRSLHIMCHIPVFCWMAATVLEKKLTAAESKDTPKTLTQMYIHFLSLHEMGMKKRLTGRRESNTECMRANLMCLGKLAFRELEKGRLVFYEKDLIENDISPTQASIFSGVYTQIFNEELMLFEEKMFSFVHLSVQEFLAALYVFLTFHNDNINVLVKKSSASRRFLSREPSELILYKGAVEKALSSESGHFDIFLRFLLGLSMEPNQILLSHLMTNNRRNQRTRSELIEHIKDRIRSSPSPDRCLNLFHCLNELNDRSLQEEIQGCLRSGSLHRTQLSPAQWNTLAFVLLTSEEELSVFELSNYSRSEEGLLRLLPVVKTATVANLNACNLTVACCEILTKTVTSSPRLRELDLSNNDLTDEGAERLSGALRSSKLQILRLRSCSLTEHSSEALASVVGSASCQLKVLDLTDNDFQDSGVKELCSGLGSPHCKLEILFLSLCRVTEEGCKYLASALSCGLRELDLSYNHPGTSGMELLFTLLDDPQCSLQKLSLNECGEDRIHPAPKKYSITITLDPNTAHKDLILDDDNRKATRWTAQSYPDHPDRFDFCRQVLCREGLTGRCYWETEWCGRVFIGVAYRRIPRKGEGNECWLGRNDSSWGLSCSKDGYKTFHNGTDSAVNIPPRSNKVGVYLDWSAGTVSFFMVSCGALTPLHTFRTTFSEPIYPGFWLAWVDSTAYLC